jgi:hypothetical protein
MFFKKYDELDEKGMLGIGITAATVAYIVESKYPSSGADAWADRINKSVDTILGNINIKPDPKTLNYLILTTTALASNPDNFISNRLAKFNSGNKGVDEHEFSQALRLVQKSSRDFLKSIK